jgi:hypothetical protein
MNRQLSTARTSSMSRVLQRVGSMPLLAAYTNVAVTGA